MSIVAKKFHQSLKSQEADHSVGNQMALDAAMAIYAAARGTSFGEMSRDAATDGEPIVEAGSAEFSR